MDRGQNLGANERELLMPAAIRDHKTAQDNQRRVSRSVLKLATLIRRSATTTYRREFGLQGNEWRALTLIGDDGPLGHQTLCDLMTLDKGQVSRVVTGLVDAGLVSRRVEGRHAVLSLAPAGQALHERLTSISFARNERILDGLDAQEVQTLFRCLDAMTANVVRMQEGEDPAVNSFVRKPSQLEPAAPKRRQAGTARR